MTKIVNLTPHTINVQIGETVHAYPASGILARVTAKEIAAEPVAGVPTVQTVYGEVEGLPEPEEGVIYIVSALVGSRVHGRVDVFGPNSGATAIRNDKGHIVAVTSLIQYL